jgi:hypothetical protein
MNKNQKILASTATVIGLTVVTATIAWIGFINYLEARFPEIDHKIIRKAFRMMLTNASLGKYSDLDSSNEEQTEALFLVEVQKLTQK